ncbi:MAG: hypothetical protein HC929_12995 [Leptolyngbyaceae cyanobacterium SM2_5_2]|nr:hypothetical protein [Leptolyngbyaceae cyanobacterium SM2_5_2]
MEEQKPAKVTLYLPPDLHRQLKIRSAVEGEAMSSIAKRAIDFYLANPGVVEDGCSDSVYGHTHVIYNCPSCSAPVVIHQGDLVEVSRLSQSGDSHTLADSAEMGSRVAEQGQMGEGELVVCS